MPFSTEETAACRRLVALALEEDLGAVGDRTSQAVIAASSQARTQFVAKSAGVLAGLPALVLVLEAVDPTLVFEPLREEGCRLGPGDAIVNLSGSLRGILAAERIALNFLQHLSGIATLTRRYVDAVAGLPCRILDTRKTLPGWRLLAKYAVRAGGGYNHRLGLFDGILIKDNHLAAFGRTPDAVVVAVKKAEAYRDSIAKAQADLWIEVEVENLTQLERALVCRPNMILLDNMNISTLRQAVLLRNETSPEILLEASGGISLDSVRDIAATGVDRISVGALTHSAPALDIALDFS
jgi:nicotinate-nucleotide pyrophosphorylase (carboxylating)